LPGRFDSFPAGSTEGCGIINIVLGTSRTAAGRESQPDDVDLLSVRGHPGGV